MKLHASVAAAALALLSPAQAESTFSPARPPSVPLAVRSPFLNLWLDGAEDGSSHGILPGTWPHFWTSTVNGWQGFVKVDGVAYNWMGNHPGPDLAEQTDLTYTSTRSTFTINVAGKVDLVVEFLSPIFPDDLMRQSLTSSYVRVSASSSDGSAHDVQIYADVSGEHASGDLDAIIEWEHGSADGVQYHKFYRQEQDVFGDVNEQASWGNWYWGIGDVDGVSVQIGEDTVVREKFINDGELDGTIDDTPRAVRDRWPVFALSRDLGSVSGDPASTLFTIGYTHEEAILFQEAEGDATHVQSLWMDYINETEIVSFFYNDFEHASEAATTLDQKVADDSTAAAGDDYLIITSLAVRQTFGALMYTNTEDDVMVFLKEISSNSDIQTVDVIFPAFPAMLYFDPNIIEYVLKPLIRYQESGQYPNDWAIHDLGRYPQAKGYPNGDDEPMPLEECGNMIIMMLAYAQRTDNNDYLTQHWPLLDQWAQYLVEEAKIPAEQLSTDDFAGHLANQTNLAIKGIIALQGMSQIADRTGNTDSVQKYADLASEYLDFWREHAINSDASPAHTVLAYDETDSYGLLYNVYGDKVLGLDFIPSDIYDMQSAFYATVNNEYGVILDTRNTWSKIDWEMFVAAVSSTDTRDMFISTLANWIGTTSTWRALTDLLDTETGGYPGIQFTARPVVGGTFALLALP